MIPEGAAALVVGAGIAGSELAHGLARRGFETLLVTTSLDTIANLPGDGWRFDPPAGGLLDRVADEARGDDGAWRSWPLHRAAKRELERLASLHVLQSNATGLLRDEAGRVVGVRTWEGVDRRGGRVALCVGTFLRARLTLGRLVERAGRLSEMAYDELRDDLESHGVPFVRAVRRLAGDDVTPGYEVAFDVPAPGGIASDGAVRGLPGLWAFGGCTAVEVALEGAARAGAEAAARWSEELGAASGGAAGRAPGDS